MNTPLAASAVVVSFNRKDDLRECLEALPPALLDEHKAEVIVMDDGSSDGTGPMAQTEFPHVRLMRNETNRGPSFSRNRASRAAQGRLLLYIDSDAVPTDRWLETMITHDDGRTVLIGAVRDYDGDRLQGGPRRATFIGKSVACAPEKANTGASCNLGVPKQCFDDIGGFDEELPYYFEDSDLCIRARLAGYNAKFLFDAVVRHKGSEVKRGHAARMQEHNSTYAMLKRYRGHPFHLMVFTLANTGWAVLRVVLYSLRGNFGDAQAILTGCATANLRFLRSARDPL